MFAVTRERVRHWCRKYSNNAAHKGIVRRCTVVVDRAGQIVERVQLPKDRTLVGFAPGGVLYLNHVRGPTKATLERATVTRP